MTFDLPRYPSYKDSGERWLRNVPSHWGVQSLGSLTTAKGKRGRPDLPLLSVVREKGVILRSSMGDDENHNVIPEDLSNYKVAHKGDLVINKMKAWQGSLGLAPCDGIVSPAYFVYDFRLADKRFGQALLRSRPYVSMFARVSDGVRLGQWDLSIDGMKRIPVPVPPAPEQSSIVRFIHSVDGRIRRYISAKQKLIMLLEEQKRVIAYGAVKSGIDPDVPLSHSGIEWIGNVPDRWMPFRLKHVAVIQTGITLGKDYGNQDLIEQPYLRVANVQAGRLDLSKITTVRVPLSEAKSTTLRPGDVLMTEGGDIDKLGRGCVWHGEIADCLHQNHVFAVRPKKSSLLPEYLVVLLASPHGRTYFETTAKKTTNLASTNSTTLGKFPLFLPKVDEQEQILKWIAVETSPLTVAQSQAGKEIVLVREYRIRLIADVVTGQVDVRQAAATLPAELSGGDEFVQTDEPLKADEVNVEALGVAPEEEVVT